MQHLVNLIPSFIWADPSGSSIYRAITRQTVPKHESEALLAELSVCLCVSVHPSIFITAYPLSVSCSHQLLLPLSLLPFDTRPALPGDEVHVWSPADHLCQLCFSVLTPDILSEREIERWRAGCAVCHENPGLCNLWTFPARQWEHTASHHIAPHHSCTHIWIRCRFFRLSCLRLPPQTWDASFLVTAEILTLISFLLWIHSRKNYLQF